ncbi:unnamed protein product [Ambrosiozyma monospora]|uniref:Unnamed protein product n=1 Tax=Ambrosiozyma monospora TaxID=43982 RepID=A0ACB5T3Q3_AMBMO|nr:unnamed protein product [Ambrosiozyma monospora]
MSQEALQKMLVEMQDQLNKQQTELQSATISLRRLTQRNREITTELKDVNDTGKSEVWQSCGKAFVKVRTTDYVSKLKQELSDNLDLLKSFTKKKNYLETSIEKTLDNFKRFTKPAGSSA